MRLVSLCLLVVMSGLVGCGAGGRLAEERFGSCPMASILGDASEVTTYRPGSGRDLPDIHYRGELGNLETSCDYGRYRGTRYTWARLDFDVAVELGTAAYPSAVDVPYFVAVIVPETQTVLTKEVFTARAIFDGDTRSVVVQEQIGRVSIPVVENTDGENYEIVIGFDLTSEQVEFNRTRGY